MILQKETLVGVTISSSSAIFNNNNNNIATINIIATDNDVLSGCRGGGSMNFNRHPGNFMFHRVVGQNKEHYRNCNNKKHKYFLVISIIKAIERQGGRFLKDVSELGEDPRYVRMPRREAFFMTLQALRES